MREIIRTSYLLFLLVIAQFSLAQDYNPLPRNLTQLYSFERAGEEGACFFAAQVDSVVLEATDSAFYLYRISRRVLPSDTQLNCAGDSLNADLRTYLLDQDHYFGQKMLRSPTGVCCFVSSVGDTFRIESQANVGDSWNWNGNIVASIDSIVIQPVLGQMDSVKYINLSNGVQILLSQNFGFVSAFSFLPFGPYLGRDTPIFELWGIPELGKGGHLPSRTEIFGFEVGDRIQTVQNWSVNSVAYGFHISSETIFGQIITDTLLHYAVTRESFEASSVPQTPVTTYLPPMAGDWTLDTNAFSHLLRLPYETPAIVSEGGVSGLQVGFQTLFNDRISLQFQAFEVYDTCSNSFTRYDEWDLYTFTEGLGMTYEAHGDVIGNGYTRIACYEKGAESFGTCRILGLLSSPDNLLAVSVQAFPNPANTVLNLVVGDGLNFSKSTVSVYGLDGRKFYSVFIRSAAQQLEIPTQDFPQGIYLLQIEKDGYQPFSQRFVVQR